MAGAPGGLEVRAEPTVPSDWDAFVRRAPGGTFCHLAGWQRVLDVLGHETLLVTARDAQGALAGVLPLAAVRSKLFGHYLVSMPFLNYGGPLGSPGARAALARWAVERARSTGADMLELRSRRAAARRDRSSSMSAPVDRARSTAQRASAARAPAEPSGPP